MIPSGDRARVFVFGLLMLAFALVALRYQYVRSAGPLVMLVAVAIWLVAFTVATLGLGLPVWRWLTGRGLDDPDAWPVGAGIGAGILVAAAGLLGAVGLLDRIPLIAILILSMGAGVVVLYREREAIGEYRDKIPMIPATLCAIGALLTLLAVAVPGPFYDQFHYHLAFPERWLRSGRIEVIPRHSYSYFPSNMGLLFDYGLSVLGVPFAQALHWWTGALTVVATTRLARAVGAGTFGSWWSATLLVATPSVLIMATWAGSDLGVAAFGAVAWLMALSVKTRETTVAWWVTAGVLCGLAVGCKYLALATVAFPVGLAVILGAFERANGTGALSTAFRRSVSFGLGLAAAFAPWGIRNAVLTGDPVYPFFASTFQKLIDTEALREASALAEGIATTPAAGEALTAILTLRTFAPKGAAGVIGPIWLAAIPAWMAWSLLVRRERRNLTLLAGLALGVVAWSQFHELGRYLVPVLVPAAAGVALCLSEIHRLAGPGLRVALVSALTVFSAWGIHGGIDQFGMERIACSFGLVRVDDMMTKWVSYWTAIPYINDKLPKDAKVLFVAESRSLYIERDVEIEDPFRVPLLIELAQEAGSAKEIAQRVESRGVTHVLFNEHEASRIARMTHRENYFETEDPDASVRLRQFLQSCLEPRFDGGPVAVFGLDTSCSVRQKPTQAGNSKSSSSGNES